MWCRTMIELEEKVCLYIWIRIGKKPRKGYCLYVGHEFRKQVVAV